MLSIQRKLEIHSSKASMRQWKKPGFPLLILCLWHLSCGKRAVWVLSGVSSHFPSSCGSNSPPFVNNLPYCAPMYFLFCSLLKNFIYKRSRWMDLSLNHTIATAIILMKIRESILSQFSKLHHTCDLIWFSQGPADWHNNLTRSPTSLL